MLFNDIVRKKHVKKQKSVLDSIAAKTGGAPLPALPASLQAFAKRAPGLHAEPSPSNSNSNSSSNSSSSSGGGGGDNAGDVKRVTSDDEWNEDNDAFAANKKSTRPHLPAQMQSRVHPRDLSAFSPYLFWQW